MPAPRPNPAWPPDATRTTFGTLTDGRTVEAVTLTDGKGMSVRVIALGAAIQSVMMPDKTGKAADIAVGYDTLEGYATKPEYFGATVGRVANRIAKGRFTLDGKTYRTPVNNGPNSLHGGTRGFDKVALDDHRREERPGRLGHDALCQPRWRHGLSG